MSTVRGPALADPARRAAAAGTGPPATPDGTGPAGWAAAGWFLVLEAVFLLALWAWQPRFLVVDDKLAQYLPVWKWLGERATWTGVPLMDPDQGSAGALAADLQYGVLDPFHWALAAVVARADSLVLAGWGLHALAVAVLGTGVVALTTHLGVGRAGAVLAALGAANSGFLLWLGGTWWPAAWGTALLPWLWWALVTRARWGLPAAVGSAYLLASSGYPYTLPFAALLVAAVVLEHGLRRRDARVWRSGRLVRRTLGAAAGALLAAPALLTAAAMAPASARAVRAADPRGNVAQFIPDVLDVVVGGPTTSVLVTGWWGTLLPPAVMATGWFVLPVAALVRWGALRGRWSAVPGLVTATVLVVAAVVATQTPTEIGSLRFPFRYAVVLQVVAPVLVVSLATAAGLVLTARRALVAGGLLLLQGLLAAARVPVLVEWHLAAATAGVAVVLLVVHVRSGRDGNVAPGRAGIAALLVATLAAPLVSVGAAVAYESHLAAVAGRPSSGLPARGVWSGVQWPLSVPAFRERAAEPGLNATVMHWSERGEGRGLGTGVPLGSAALFSDVRPGYGYTSLGQEGWARRWCQNFLGLSWCGNAGALLEPVPGTDVSWFSVMAKDVVLAGPGTPPELVEELGSGFRRVGPQGGFVRYERRTPTEGRVTHRGADVEELTAVRVTPDRESYQVRWRDGDDARLVTRIPWWPGYRATLDGREIPVTPVDRTVVAVELPSGGGSGELEIFFEPPGLRIGLAAAALATLLAVVLMVAELRAGRRTARRAAAT